MNSLRRNRRRLMNEINVVPYIDVMLVLLVIFMVTAPLMNPGLVDLPSVGKSAVPPAAPLEVLIRKDETLSLRDHAKGGKESAVTLEELLVILKSRQSDLAERPVVISADKQVRYEAVMKVMDALQQQDIRKVGLLTQARGR